MNPTISCITPTFNRAHLLPRAIESTINQTYPNWEMIIVDDGSEDKTEEVVQKYVQKDARVKYYKNPGKGGNAARNYGIRQAKGEWIAFLDDDAENLPERFRKQLDAATQTGSSFLVSGYIAVGGNGSSLIVNNGLWVKAAGITSRWFIKKNLLLKAGLFDEGMPAMQENELSYRIAQHEIYYNHLVVVIKEYDTPGSVSKGERGIDGAKMVLDKHESKMQNLEAAWWYYKIAMGLIVRGNYIEARKYYYQAAIRDYRKVFYVAYLGVIAFAPFKSKITSKFLIYILGKLYSIKFPVLVNHKVVCN